MLFAEALLERGGEVNIVLPFSKNDFKKASVNFIPNVNLEERFERVLQNAATVVVLNEFGESSDGAEYEYCNQALKGLALLKGQFLGIDVMPLAVWDGRKGDGRGGTQNFIEYWEQRGSKVEVIYLDKVLYPERAAQALPPIAAAAAEPAPPKGENPEDVAEQEIKAMLFADIVGYTKLSELQVPPFVHHFLKRLSALMDSMKKPPIVRNTWGDAIYCVFDHVHDAGVFAVALREMVLSTDWTEFSLPDDLSIRIALHAGPVYPCFDPVLRRLTFLGSHVNRTARIEPIVEEGQIYASQAFAALSAAEGVTDYVCDYVGTKHLAKRFGTTPVFLVRLA
jgi:class 3 adenylate cyclase